MNSLIKKLFVAVRYDDRMVVFADTTLKGFIDGCKQDANISGMKSVSYYQYKFKDQEVIHHVDKFGKLFYLQKVM